MGLTPAMDNLGLLVLHFKLKFVLTFILIEKLLKDKLNGTYYIVNNIKFI